MSGAAKEKDFYESGSNPLIQGGRSDAHLFPIDETEEFHDPFSDLSLFLSRKVKKEIRQKGSVKGWSFQIQEELFKKILPEFKQVFPKYRLGATALKKIWEKVSYYYSKVNHTKEAFQSDGKLNIEYMIRENLRNHPTKPSAHLPPYTLAQQLASKMSECIATLDGVRPNLDHLTKVIWSVQKHLIPNLSAMHAKSPYEEYDLVDKVIVKTLLEITSSTNHLPAHKLAERIHHRLELYKDLAEGSPLTSLISSLLASSQTFHSSGPLIGFIDHFINLFDINAQLSDDANRLEIVGRILSLYPIAANLPNNITEDKLKEVIRYAYDQATENETESVPSCDQTLLLFINAEVNMLASLDYDFIEKEIIETYKNNLGLPTLTQDELEIAIWQQLDHTYSILDNAPEEYLDLIQNEIGNQLIDNPAASISKTVLSTQQFLRKVGKIELSPRELFGKLEIWTNQNDMLCRFVHFDEKAPLLKLLKSHYKESADKAHLIDSLAAAHIKDNPKLAPYKAQVKSRLLILIKYIFYHEIKEGETTYSRFALWHKDTPNKAELTPLIPSS